MSAGAYSEERIVEQPAIALFAELGWQTVSAMEERFGAGGTLGRETSGEERTKEVFGDYVSVYDFQQSIEDGATVPLFYENRTESHSGAAARQPGPERGYQLIENATLDPEQEARLEKELSRQYHLITRDDRLDTVAKDIGRHFSGRGFQGKAMVVSIDKATALRMYEKVRKHWPGGAVVDYANVFASLERALAIYAQGRVGQTPVRDKKELVAELPRAVAAANGVLQAARRGPPGH